MAELISRMQAEMLRQTGSSRPSTKRGDVRASAAGSTTNGAVNGSASVRPAAYQTHQV